MLRSELVCEARTIRRYHPLWKWSLAILIVAAAALDATVLAPGSRSQSTPAAAPDDQTPSYEDIQWRRCAELQRLGTR
jgi:hypothetical protein